MFRNALRSIQIFQAVTNYYLILDLVALGGPLLLSFDKRVAYYKQWKAFILAALIIAVPFLIHDELFTKNGFWGFNPDHLIGIYAGHLPLEELLFFIIVPFSCYFIYACVKYYLNGLNHQLINRIVQLAVLIYATVLIFTRPEGWYTATIVPASILTLFIWTRSDIKKPLGLSFLLSLIPFLIMNGALTGSFSDEPVVWYSELEKVPGRIFTIPFEDVLYAFTLIIGVSLLADRFQQGKK